jgi:hypothetical protein
VVTTRSLLGSLVERQISDATRLRRVVAHLQRNLGDIFGNAHVQRRNRRYEIRVAVYEKPIPGSGRAYRMPAQQIRAWVHHAAEQAHPRLPRRLSIAIQPWQGGRVSQKTFCPVLVNVDAQAT